MAEHPPQAPILFPADPAILLQHTKEAIQADKLAEDTIVATIKPEDASFDTVLLPLLRAGNIYSNAISVFQFPKDISPDADLRAAARQAEKLTNDYALESGMRQDVFRLVQAVVDRVEQQAQHRQQLTSERMECLRKVHRSFLQNGLGIADPSRRDRFKQVQQRINDVCAKCKKNFSAEKGGLWLSMEELDGLPQNSLDQLKMGGGEWERKLWLTLKPPDYVPAMKYITNGAVRKKIFLAFENKCILNTPLVKELYILRDEAARLLGYKNNAERRIEDSLAGSLKFVIDFLNDLRERMTPVARESNQVLLDLKTADLRKRGLQPESKLHLWDTAYYSRILREQQYALNELAVSEYFPLEMTLKGMLSIFERAFGMRFHDIRCQLSTEIVDGLTEVFHEDMRAYKVCNADNTNEFVGHLYLDLHPRDFKYTHNSHTGIHRGYSETGVLRHFPTSILICNFTKPLADRPSLLRHRECVTFFHELGHAIHNLVSKTEFAMVHGTRVARDFVEAPSKMLENWFWEPTTLKAISHHYSHLGGRYAVAWKAQNMPTLVGPSNLPPQSMPDEMIDSTIRSRYAASAHDQLFQIFCATYDLTVHSPEIPTELEHLDFQRLYNSLRHEITLVDGPDDDYTWGNNHAKFAHLWGSYDARYYGYVLATSIASDMYQSAFAGNSLDPEAGALYRKTVLEPGGSIPAMDLLERFLGRRPSNEAWLKQMGYLPRVDSRI